jgi:hypothetical protein
MGPIGVWGPQGIPGIDGHQGPQGLSGKDGRLGKTGPIGEKGTDGKPGVQGVQGDVGPQGGKGDVGRPPKHEWNNDNIRFQNPDLTWGKWINLKKVFPATGAIMGGGGDILDFKYAGKTYEGKRYLNIDQESFYFREEPDGYTVTLAVKAGQGFMEEIDGGFANTVYEYLDFDGGFANSTYGGKGDD